MADDGTLKIGTQVNVGPLQQGMAQAQSTVKSAFSTMANDAEIWAKVSASGSMKAAEALDRYAKFAAEAQARVEQLGAAEEKEATGLRGGMSARMAASAELRVLEGNLNGSTRAAGAFLTTLPGIGTAMQVAFPVFGVIALVEVLAKGAEALSKWKSALETLSASEAKFHSQMLAHANDEFSINKLLVQSEFALAEARANSPVEKDRVRLQMQQAMVELGDRHVDQLKAAMKQLESYGQAQKTVADVQKDMAKDALAHGNLGLAAVAAYGAIRAGGQAGAPYAPGKDGGDSEMEKNHKEIERAQAELNEAKAKGIEDGHKITRDGLKEDHKAEEEARRASEAVIRAQEALLVAKEAVLGKSAETSASFWAAEVATTRKGSIENIHALEAMQRAQAEIITSTNSERRRFATESAAAVSDITAEQAKPDVSGIQNASKATTDWLRAVRDGAAIQQTSDLQIAQASIKAQEASGSISKLAAAQAQAALETRRYEQELARLKAQLDAINNAPYLSDMEKKGQGLAVQNQIGNLQANRAAQTIGSQAQINQQIAQPYTKAFDTINSSWLQLQGKLIFGTKNIGREFANMGVGILTSFASTAEQFAIKWAEKELLTLVLHQTTNAAKVASDTAAAATSVAATSAANVASVTSYSAVAAAAAAASVAAIPLIGWSLAPGVAAATFASTEAYAGLAAFAQGGIVAGYGGVPIMAHAGERVLTVEQTRSFERLVDNSTRNTSSAHQTIHFHGNTDQQFKDQISRHSGRVLEAVHRGLRNKGRV